ncbi:hypothetical protein BE08_40770 [Sorangium cellulosum]|uniref:Uncharacterized protein n=1 Tax=Sorangium cellulosum TaxID=56 RepID=A0A150P178_SORCE|nr:hypothetical protein BE08_40770 [Sorangium cellulosum]
MAPPSNRPPKARPYVIGISVNGSGSLGAYPPGRLRQRRSPTTRRAFLMGPTTRPTSVSGTALPPGACAEPLTMTSHAGFTGTKSFSNRGADSPSCPSNTSFTRRPRCASAS